MKCCGVVKLKLSPRFFACTYNARRISAMRASGERTELQNKKHKRATTLIKYENLLNCFYVAQL